MDSSLRPMSTSQLLDRTFHVYRANFLLCIGISLIVPTLILLVQLGFAFLGFRPNTRMAVSTESAIILGGTSFLLIITVSTFGGAMAQGATVFAVSRIHLGHSVTIGESYRQVLSRFGAVLAIFISVSLRTFAPYIPGGAVMAAGFVFLFPGTAGGASDAAVWFGLLMLGALALLAAGVVGSLYLYARYALAVPACVLEKTGASAALRRSSFLSKDSIMRIILVFFLLGVLSAVFSTVLNLPAQIYSFQHRGILNTPMLVWGYAATFVARAIVGPVAAIALALIYYDQRVRKEAFDLQLLMQALEQTPPAPGAAAATIG
ncbi:MAG TPA: hypothetical protein VN176_06340 [Verrucomicrobiae bacterium]|jgi:hypothetical protein|nr:hypothetical protein [Verrucomicrobiae bacterium]